MNPADMAATNSDHMYTILHITNECIFWFEIAVI